MHSQNKHVLLSRSSLVLAGSLNELLEIVPVGAGEGLGRLLGVNDFTFVGQGLIRVDAHLKVARDDRVFEQLVLEKIWLCAVKLLLHFDGVLAIASATSVLDSHVDFGIGRVAEDLRRAGTLHFYLKL